MDSDLIGRKLGPYEVIEFIGQGAMAEIYLGYHHDLKRKVAIKIIGRSLQSDPVFNARFRREAKAIARLNHPNIVKLSDFGAAEGGHYMVMEYIEGITLADLIVQVNRGERTLYAEDVTFIVRQIAAALDHAHSKDVIHRDVKPENIMIARSGQAILTDFGLALLRSRNAEDKTSGTAFGTPEYMSPEQIADSRMASRFSDIYSLGVIVYELCTGELPFEADSPVDMALRHLHESAPDPRYLNPELPLSVAQAIQKAMSKEPRDRYANAMQFAIALEWAYDHPEAELPPLPGPRLETSVEEPTQRQDNETVVAHRGPSKVEERREKRRLRAAHQQMQREETKLERQTIQALKAEKRRENKRLRERKRIARQEKRQRFFATWARTLIVIGVLAVILAALVYLLQTAGVIAIQFKLPSLPAVRPTKSAETDDATPTLIPTLTPVPTNTSMPTATALVPAPENTVPPTEFTSLDVGTSAFRVHDGQVLQFIPEGQFIMGTDSLSRNRIDRPAHAVQLSNYWIDRTEVTNDQYRLCIDAGKCSPPVNLTYFDDPEFADYPVTFVRYEDSVAYCLWIASETDLVTGLPTEAQWEKAAGWDPTIGKARKYPWGDDSPTPDLMRFNESVTNKPAAPVGSYPGGASAYGALDMAGNVWEWVSDWFDAEYYNRTGVSLDPSGPLSGTLRLVRGGSWTREGEMALSSLRNPVSPTAYANDMGFRCAMTVERPAPASGILLAPVDLTQTLLDMLEEARTDPANSQAAIDDWVERVEALRSSLQTGDKANSLALVEERLSRIESQGNSGLLSEKLTFQLKQAMLWMADELS